MNSDRIVQIVADTTRPYRKGEQIVTESGAVEVFAMPSVTEAPSAMPLIDVHFVSISVDMTKAQAYRAELLTLLSEHPRFAAGPSYIEVGALLGDQGIALALFALGQALDFWTIITPESLGATGRAADEMAGIGLIFPDGFRAA